MEEEKKEEIVSLNKDLFSDLSIDELEKRLEMATTSCWVGCNLCSLLG